MSLVHLSKKIEEKDTPLKKAQTCSGGWKSTQQHKIKYEHENKFHAQVQCEHRRLITGTGLEFYYVCSAALI